MILSVLHHSTVSRIDWTALEDKDVYSGFLICDRLIAYNRRRW